MATTLDPVIAERVAGYHEETSEDIKGSSTNATNVVADMKTASLSGMTSGLQDVLDRWTGDLNGILGDLTDMASCVRKAKEGITGQDEAGTTGVTNVY